MDILIDDAPQVRCMKVGDVLRASVEREDSRKEKETYTVKRVFPFNVLAEDGKGVRRSFSYGDLIRMGVERQEPDIEALRIIY